MSTDAAAAYAQTTAVLAQTDGALAASVFDTALTNGLVVIVGENWPAQTTRTPTDPRLRSARGLLDVIEKYVPVDAAGVSHVPGHPGRTVPVAVSLFRAALDRTQPVRHGRGGLGDVTAAEIDALQDLDLHPGLGGASVAALDQRETDAVRADAVERSRAAAFIEDLDDDELARRVRIAADAAPFDPKDLQEWTPPQDCPVCGHESLKAERTDDLGYGIAAGTCTVCSYRRSTEIMDGLALETEWKQRWADQ